MAPGVDEEEVIKCVDGTLLHLRNLDCLFLLRMDGGRDLLGIYLRSTVMESRRALHYLLFA